MTQMIRCLSLWQPWACVMLYGPKDLENRPWTTKVRGPLLVHAAMTKRDMRPETDRIIRKQWDRWTLAKRPPVVFGAIVGIVEVTGCGTPEDYPGNPWAWGPFCHAWAKRQAFHAPVPYRGSQGFFNVPLDLVREQLALLKRLPDPPSASSAGSGRGRTPASAGRSSTRGGSRAPDRSVHPGLFGP